LATLRLISTLTVIGGKESLVTNAHLESCALVENHIHKEVTVRRIQQRLFAKVFRSQRKPVQISKNFQHLT
jgi:hypothetical protein